MNIFGENMWRSFVEEGLLDLDRDVNQYLTSWKVPENEFITF